eukprot:scaffold8496_cov66-Cyclotella_meneghiniana.AAC.18
MTKPWSRQLAASILLATRAKESIAFHIGQEVCISGYITCLDCNVGGMLPYNTKYNMFQTISHPESHNLQCLVDNESCISDGYEIVSRYAIGDAENKDEENEVYCRSFKLDSNSSTFIAAASVSHLKTSSTIVIGGLPVSFAGQITDLGRTHSSLATVALDTDTLILNAGGCANENLPHHCISQSNEFTMNSPTVVESPSSAGPPSSVVVTDVYAIDTSDSEASSTLISASSDYPSSVAITDAFTIDSSDFEATSSLIAAESSLAATDVFVADVDDSQTEDDNEVLNTSELGTNGLPPSSAPVISDPPTFTNSTSATVTSTSAMASASNNDTFMEDRGEIVIGDVFKVDSSQEPTYFDKEMEIKQHFKTHGILAGASWGIVVPLAMSAAWFRDSFSDAKNGGASCFSKTWLVIHASMAVAAAIATSVSVYFVVKALQLEGGWEYAMKFSGPHEYIGLFLLFGAWVQVLGGILRPRHKNTGHAKMSDDADDEENTLEAEENDDASTSTANGGAMTHNWRKSTSTPAENVEVCDESVIIAPKSKARAVWEYGHRLFALVLVICGFWQLFSGLDVYQERYGDDSYLVTACMVWVGIFWSAVFLLTCFFKKF